MPAASFLTPERHSQEELLDLGAGTQRDVEASLRDLWRINRYLGGIPPLTRHLYPRLRVHTGVVTVADIGAGSGEIAALIARWAARNGVALRLLALDVSMRHLDVARHHTRQTPAVSLVQADVMQLPLGVGQADYIVSSLFLHHFAPEQVIAILRDTFARARCGIIMSDTQRGQLPLIAFRLLQPVFARSYITRFDGAASVRRAYTPAEFRALALEAGLENVRVFRHFPFRMTLTADKTAVNVDSAVVAADKDGRR